MFTGRAPRFPSTPVGNGEAMIATDYIRAPQSDDEQQDRYNQVAADLSEFIRIRTVHAKLGPTRIALDVLAFFLENRVDYEGKDG